MALTTPPIPREKREAATLRHALLTLEDYELTGEIDPVILAATLRELRDALRERGEWAER